MRPLKVSPSLRQCRPRILYRTCRFKIRHLSSQATSYTAVHPSLLETSPKRLALHNLLLRLQATNQFDEARLQLALRGLEQSDAPVRIAIIGLKESSRPGRLLRLLFADPAAKKSADWEDALSIPPTPGHGILLRQGNGPTLSFPKNMPVSVISLSNQRLQQQFPPLEFLVTNLTGIAGNVDPFAPSLTLGYGRPVVRYPVHKSVVVVEDLEGLLSGSLQGLQTRDQKLSVVVAVDETLGETMKDKTQGSESYQFFLPLDRAEQTLVEKRKSEKAAEGTDWSQRMIDNVYPIITHSLAPSSAKTDVLLPHVQSLIQTILNSPLPPLPPRPTLQTTQRQLSSSLIERTLSIELSQWSRSAHNDLRQQLDIGFSEPPYTRLAWWKLIWTVDDVKSVCESVIKDHFLRDAERKAWWLGGRVVGEGYSLPEGSSTSTFVPETSSRTSTIAIDDIPAVTPAKLLRTKLPPYPSQITTARQTIISTTLLPLHRKAQTHLWTFLSTSAFSSGLSGVLYLSDYSMYSSLSVFAFGFVYAARRLQKRWEKTLKTWEGEVREDGRSAIAGVETWVGTCIAGEKMDSSLEERMWEQKLEERKDVEALVVEGIRLLRELTASKIVVEHEVSEVKKQRTGE